MSSRVRSVFVLAGLLTLVAAAVFRLGTDVSQAAVSSTLHASVGPGFEISLVFDDGTPVTALPAGSYRVVVSDVAQDHNFHLVGPGVDLLTPIDERASPTWNVVFREDSRYTFLCDPHADEMRGSFTVGSPVAEAPPAGGGGGGGGTTTNTPGSGGSKAAASIATVQAALGGAGKFKLTVKGKAVSALEAGKYTFVVTDPSKLSTVTLGRTGAATRQLTGLAFVGKKTVAITLAAGQWKLALSPRGAASAVSFRVTKA